VIYLSNDIDFEFNKDFFCNPVRNIPTPNNSPQKGRHVKQSTVDPTKFAVEKYKVRPSSMISYQIKFRTFARILLQFYPEQLMYEFHKRNIINEKVLMKVVCRLASYHQLETIDRLFPQFFNPVKNYQERIKMKKTHKYIQLKKGKV